jgi:predicted  nucleic acid-binding Zn-ribbon protein
MPVASDPTVEVIWRAHRIKCRALGVFGAVRRANCPGLRAKRKTVAGDLKKAVAAIEAALERLEKGLEAAGTRMEELPRLRNEAQRLAADRARLASALDKMTVKAQRLDKAAETVSLRLMDTMDKVKLALNRDEAS